MPIRDYLGPLVITIPFETLNMLQEANSETLLMAEIFNIVKENEQTQYQGSDLNLELLIAVNDYLYIKTFNKDTIEVFKNQLFSVIAEDEQYILFLSLQLQGIRKREDRVFKKTILLLQEMNKKICCLSDSTIQMKNKNIIINQIIKTELGV